MADQVETTKILVITVSLITVLVVLTMLLITSRLNNSVKGVVDDLDYKAKNDQTEERITFRELWELSGRICAWLKAKRNSFFVLRSRCKSRRYSEFCIWGSTSWSCRYIL